MAPTAVGFSMPWASFSFELEIHLYNNCKFFILYLTFIKINGRIYIGKLGLYAHL